MDVSIVGSGHVGTTVAACLADYGHEVVNIDINKSVVTQINAGESPINEPGVGSPLMGYADIGVTATMKYDRIRETDVTFLALPTPSNVNRGVDTPDIKTAAEAVGDALADTADEHTLAVKSMVIPETTDHRFAPTVRKRAGDATIHVAANPEFLRMWSAVEDFRHPDKIVVGGDTVAVKTLTVLYKPICEATSAPAHPITAGPRETEMIKYANNVFLASKMSLINRVKNVCKEFGVDAYEVADALGLNHRIFEQFLRSGLGWGGSCFPEDTAALIAARDCDYQPTMLEAAMGIKRRTTGLTTPVSRRSCQHGWRASGSSRSVVQTRHGQHAWVAGASCDRRPPRMRCRRGGVRPCRGQADA